MGGKGKEMSMEYSVAYDHEPDTGVPDAAYSGLSGNMLVTFPNQEMYRASTAAEGPPLPINQYVEEADLFTVAAPITDHEQEQFERWAGKLVTVYGATVRPERQFYPDDRPGSWIPDLDPEQYAHERLEEAQASLADVVRAIGADRAHRRTRGKGAIIAVIDTGIHGSRAVEFPDGRRHSGMSFSPSPVMQDPWDDDEGHGTMCAAIAAASPSQDLPLGGIAPEAGLISCRTSFREAETMGIFSRLSAMAREGRRIVASCSFGFRTGTPPIDPGEVGFERELTKAIDNGVVVCFSAGNYHQWLW